jgi:hypothetical protein
MNYFIEAFRTIKLASKHIRIGNNIYEIRPEIITSDDSLLDPAHVAELEGMNISEVMKILGGNEVFLKKVKKHNSFRWEKK